MGYNQLLLRTHKAYRRTIEFCARNGFRPDSHLSSVSCKVDRSSFKKALTTPIAQFT